MESPQGLYYDGSHYLNEWLLYTTAQGVKKLSHILWDSVGGLVECSWTDFRKIPCCLVLLFYLWDDQYNFFFFFKPCYQLDNCVPVSSLVLLPSPSLPSSHLWCCLRSWSLGPQSTQVRIPSVAHSTTIVLFRLLQTGIISTFWGGVFWLFWFSNTTVSTKLGYPIPVFPLSWDILHQCFF